MKKIIILAIILSVFLPAGISNASFELISSPEWEELEIAAEMAEIKIERTRPIELEDYRDILVVYVGILEDRIREMGLIPFTQIKVSF